MVSAKTSKGATVQVDYVIHIQDIKPWPPSQSLRSLRSVLVQWENGDRRCGSTNTAVPSIGSIVGEGKIDFNESFRLPVTLIREVSGKGKVTDSFQRNILEFNLCEPRREKIQTLATGVIDLADYGIVKETISVSTPMNSHRSFRNTSQPMLYIQIQPVERGHNSSSSMEGKKNGGESISALMNEEYAEEAEVASFTFDDMSSHSSSTNGGLPPQTEENGTNGLAQNKAGLNKGNADAPKLGIEEHITSQENLKESSSCSSSIDLSSDLGSPINGHASVLSPPNSTSRQMAKHQDFDEKVTNYSSAELRGDANNNIYNSYVEDMDMKQGQENQLNSQDLEHKRLFLDDEPIDSMPEDSTKNEGLFETSTASLSEGDDMKGSILKTDRPKIIKSVRSSPDSAKSNGLVNRNQLDDVKESGAVLEGQSTAGIFKLNERKIAKVYPQDTRTTILDGKIQHLQNKIKMLEGELREAAGVEASLYSIVAEHGSSISKVHAPARRLSRLYLHACGESSGIRRAGAARSAVSGLVLVAKACGNDVPRLTFWLSNSVMLRAIIHQAIIEKEIPLPMGENIERNGATKGNKMTSSSMKWKEPSPSINENKNFTDGDLCNLEDPFAFLSALERVEAWIFSRTVESIWWQTLTPHMQSDATKAIDRLISLGSKKNLGRSSSSIDQDQVNFSLELWKQAFKDACERLCPVRAAGHDCGCLPELARLIMEQCVARLDVAMFNAILRESADDIPTDPVSDPISDSRVLPILAGKASFGAGAQLKNAIGNWSRWLTDLFGIDDDSVVEDEDDEKGEVSFKSFHLLNALSDLMMLPKDMLLSRSIRKEVCPTFGTPLIKRVLDNFVSDEFCPDPIPDVVLEALGSEDPLETEEDESITTTPCTAAPPLYTPPLAASVAANIGGCGSQSQLSRSSSLLRKSYTSDNELDELNSPFASIFLMDGSQSSGAPTRLSWKSKEMSNQYSIRYELLRDVWMNGD
ncbi:hypothetical protein M5689_009228 [Euphorbia peplus]|nr:hypothetical protein M5689_009228 [Euphorbia peplus]